LPENAGNPKEEAKGVREGKERARDIPARVLLEKGEGKDPGTPKGEEKEKEEAKVTREFAGLATK
jgi:hypothetical protein